MQQYNNLSFEISTLVTSRYSTSFTRGIKTLEKKYRDPVYAVYGFVRLADEIVDTFHDYDRKNLFYGFKNDTWKAIGDKISTNPVLHAFQLTVHNFNIDKELIESFLHSMEQDLEATTHDEKSYRQYIYGSAEVVGLMCLHIFCEGNRSMYDQLCEPARKLGAAFQKVNFLRDIKSDFAERGRVYFPGVNFNKFNTIEKQKIEAEIEKDFKAAYPGVMQLPEGVRPGVYTAFIYYRELLSKIKKTPASRVTEERIRIPDIEKLVLLLRTYTKFGFNSF